MIKSIIIPLYIICILSLTLFNTVNSFSQTSPELDAKKKEPELNLAVGAMLSYVPDYEGSDSYEYKFLPTFMLNYKSLTLGINGFGMGLIKNENFHLITIFGYGGGRDEDADENLNGTGDIEKGILATIDANIKYGFFALGGKYQRQLSGENTGYTFEYKLGLFMPLNKTFMMGISLNTTYGDDVYMEKYFGINSVQSSRSGHPTYVAKAGFKSAGASLIFDINISENVSIKVMSGYKKFLEDAKNSPIVLDKEQFNTGIGLNLKF